MLVKNHCEDKLENRCRQPRLGAKSICPVMPLHGYLRDYFRIAGHPGSDLSGPEAYTTALTKTYSQRRGLSTALHK
jgi:hypothetical protein